jgi:3-deoxy-D-manno-octulosonic-acid transferase
MERNYDSLSLPLPVEFSVTVALILYKLFLRFYQTGIHLLSAWNPKAKAWVDGRKNSFPALADLSKDGGTWLWMHCASIGEFEQGKPVIERIRRDQPRWKILVSFFSPTGFALQKDYPGADCVCYLPLDSAGHAEAFVSAVNPKLVLWIKHEYWYFYLRELRKRQIPTLLISAIFRPDQSFFRWYGRLHRSMLDCFSHLFVQTPESLDLLGQLGITGRVSVSGDTRFDRVIEIAENSASPTLIRRFCGHSPVIVAGSTWEEDEEVLRHYAQSHPEIRFIIAPHDTDEELLRDLDKLFPEAVHFSTLEGRNAAAVADKEPANVLILDNVGMLAVVYRFGFVCYVGGGFTENGVHNVLEAAVYGKPVLYGPAIDGVEEASDLVERGGGLIVHSALEAEEAFNQLFESPEKYRRCATASREYVYEQRGATERIMHYIQENRLLTS